MNRYGSVCALIAVLMASVFVKSTAANDPSTLPRIEFQDLTYIGAFRLPSQTVNGDAFDSGGYPITFNPGRNSLFASTRRGNVGEVAIPTPVLSNDILKLPFATLLQGFNEPTEGTIHQVSPTDAALSGLLAIGDRLYGAAAIYYDANNTQRVSHYSRSTTLSTPGVIGMRQVWLDAMTGFVSGYMATVPPEWQSLLGGPAVTGECCLPVAWRTSWGPSAFAFNPADINSMAKVPATPLLYYPQDHHTLGHWDASGSVYGGTTQITGVAILAGTRTALFFGRNGTGTFCYGNGTSNKSLEGTVGPDGEIFCYDPTSTAKGQHAYPYNYQIWAYDLNELAAVKAGTKQPWDVKPYGVWPFSLPFPEPQVQIGGVGYDSSRQILYVSQMFADKDGYGYRPIIHALKVGGGAAGTPLPEVDSTPLPEPSTTAPSSWTVSAVALAANRTAPQLAGTTVTWTATPTGGAAPHQYKWLQHDGTQWTALTGWSTSNTYNWTPAYANGAYRIGVWVRSVSNTADQPESTASADFAISGTTSATSPTPAPTGSGTYYKVNAVSMSADRPSPQAAGTAIKFTATSAGGPTPHQYKWLVHDGSQWSVAANWGTSNTFTWTPAIANGAYRVGVWVKSAGNAADQAEETSSMDFAISGTTSTSTPAPAPTTSGTYYKVNAVSMSADRPAPQAAGTAVRFTATSSGGPAPHQYKWLVHNGQQWSIAANWSTSNTFTWTPAVANAAYRVGVWVKSAGNGADQAEETSSMDYAIVAGTSAPAPAPAPTTGTTTYYKVNAVTVSANRAAPQPAGTTITWSATSSGGPAPHQYKWLVHNGSQWSVAQNWSTNNTFAWTPAVANAAYRVGVWVRSATNTADQAEETASADFAISGTTSTTTTAPPPVTSDSANSSGLPASAVSLTPNAPAPRPAGSTIVFTASPTGGTAPHQYKWLIHDGTSWTVAAAWSATNTFSWTPAAANAAYRIGVWVRSAGKTTDTAEATASIDYAISAATVTAPAPTTSTSSWKISAVTLGANKIAPQAAGTTIQLSALPSGGSAPYQYKWLVHDGNAWAVVANWTTSNTFNWTPSTPNAAYRIGVWARSGTNTADQAEATASMDYPIAGTATTAPAPTAPTTSSNGLPTSAVTISANTAAPLLVNTTATFTAMPTGGTGPHQYQWLLHDGSSWSVVSTWSTSNSFSWTPAAYNPSYRVGVWVRSAGKTADTPEATASIDFPTRR